MVTNGYHGMGSAACLVGLTSGAILVGRSRSVQREVSWAKDPNINRICCEVTNWTIVVPTFDSSTEPVRPTTCRAGRASFWTDGLRRTTCTSEPLVEPESVISSIFLVLGDGGIWGDMGDYGGMGGQACQGWSGPFRAGGAWDGMGGPGADIELIWNLPMWATL